MPNEVSLTCRSGFSASHYYRIPAWSEEKNAEYFAKAANPNGHGHNYSVEVTLRGTVNPETGMVMNIKTFKELVRQTLQELDHRHLNLEIDYFKNVLPTPENIAGYLWEKLSKKTLTGKLERIRVYEEEFTWAEMTAPSLPFSFTRAYRFSAAHRLYAPTMSLQDNAALYGECSNPLGHGHDYLLEVTVEGSPDSQTGSPPAVGKLDAFLEEKIIGPWDHRRLDEDVEELAGVIPSGENLVRILWDKIQNGLPDSMTLVSVKLGETPTYFFEYTSSSQERCRS